SDRPGTAPGRSPARRVGAADPGGVTARARVMRVQVGGARVGQQVAGRGQHVHAGGELRTDHPARGVEGAQRKRAPGQGRRHLVQRVPGPRRGLPEVNGVRGVEGGVGRLVRVVEQQHGLARLGVVERGAAGVARVAVGDADHRATGRQRLRIGVEEGLYGGRVEAADADVHGMSPGNGGAHARLAGPASLSASCASRHRDRMAGYDRPVDSLSQIVLGGALAAAIAPARHRRAAVAAGAALGTLPDLDSVPMWLLGLDPVTNMTWHRGPSHSLLVLVPLAALLWGWLRGRGGRVAEAPTRWYWAITLALVTHPVLDAFTVYGTQLWWPLPPSPAMWSSVFIIDPLSTLPLLLAFVLALVRGWRPSAQAALVAGLALSTAYLGWSLVAKAMVGRAAETTLAGMGLQDAPRFSVPMPFNTLLWRVVVMTPDGF